MTRLTQQSSAELQERFEACGHVYIPDVYDPVLGGLVGTEIDDLFYFAPQYQNVVLGEQKKSLLAPKFNPEKHKHTLEMLGAIGAFTGEMFGHDLRPTHAHDRFSLVAIEMRPIIRTCVKNGELKVVEVSPIYGFPHVDLVNTDGPTAITTYYGESELKYDDGAHTLRPGGVVVVDPTRLLEHQATAAVNRKALTIAHVVAKSTN